MTNPYQPSANHESSPQINYSRAQYEEEFRGERATLVKLAFEDCQTVTIEEQLSGYSGAQTWRVATDEGEVFVIKIAHIKMIEREHQNYRTYRVFRLRNAARQEGEPVKIEGGEWALLKSTFARIRQSQTLLEYLSKKQEADISKILHDIFRGTDDGWWQSDQKKRIKWGVYYDRLLPEHLRVEAFGAGSDASADPLKAGEVAQDLIAELERKIIEQHHRPNLWLENFYVEKVRGDVLTICAEPPANVESPKIRIKVMHGGDATVGKNISLYAKNIQTRRELLNAYARQVVPTFVAHSETFDSEYIKYANPIPYIQEILETTTETKFSTIHGDLNLQNILIELGTDSNKRYRDNWLIDFAETGKGPVLLDLQWLEVQVITWSLAPAIQAARENINKLQDVFDALAELTDWPSHLPPALRTPYKVILEIRRLVEKEYLAITGDWSEYYRGLVIALLGSLRFEQLNDFARKVAFVSAATVIGHAEVLPNHLKDLPKPLIIGPRPSEQPIIDINSLPSKVTPKQKFVLRGGATPSTALQVKANQIVIANIMANDKGIWETTLEFDRVGGYQITVHDYEANLQSEQVRLEVLNAPTISNAYLPTQILPGRSLQMRGTGRSNATIQLLANDQFVAETTCNQSGRWQMEIALTSAGDYELRVHDEEMGIESVPVQVMVLMQPKIAETNLPKQIIANTNFMVEGEAAPNAAIKLLANKQILTTVQANQTGRWHGGVTLPAAGKYELTALDEKGGIESNAVAVSVRKQGGGQFWIQIMIGALSLLAIYLGADTFFPEQVRSIPTTIAGFLGPAATSTVTLPPTVTPTVKSTATPPPMGGTADSARAYFQAKGKIIVAASIESGPYVYKDNDGQFKGFEAELVREFARRWFPREDGTDLESADVLQFADTKVAERAQKVIEPGIDFLIGSVTYLQSRCTGERLCSKGYSTDPQALIVNTANPVSGYCDTNLDTPQTIFIVLAGTTGDTTFEGYKQQCEFTQIRKENIQYVQTRQNALDEILNNDGRIKVYKSNLALLQFAVNEHKQADQFKVISGEAISLNEPYSMWLNGQHVGLRDLIDETLTEMQKDGTFADLCTEAGGTLIGDNCNFKFAPTPPAIITCDPTLLPIKIGIAINEGGRYAVFGQDQILGYNLAFDYLNHQQNGVNGRCIELAKVDLASRTDLEEDTEWLINQFNWLMEQGVVAIIGPGLSQQVDLMGDFWQSFKVPVIGPSTTKPKLVCDKDFFARISASGLWYVTEAVEEAYQSLTNVNVAKVIIAFAQDDEFTNAESAIFRNYVTDAAMQQTYNFVGDYPYQINDPATIANLDNRLAEIAADIYTANPDIIIISGLTRDGAALIKALRAAGYTKPIVGGNGLNTPYIFNGCTGDCRDFENFFVPQAYSPLQSKLPIQQAFLTAYTTADSEVLQQQKPRFDPNPGQFAAQMFTAVQVLVKSLEVIDEQTPIQDENLGQEDALVELRQKLNQQLLEGNTLFETPLGPIRLTSEGEVVQTQFYVAQSVKNADDNGYHFETGNSLVIEDAEERAESACTAE